MLRLNRFQYLAPRSLRDTHALLDVHGHDAMLMAGGTDLLVNIKHRICTPAIVIAIRDLPELQGLDRGHESYLTVGAGTSLQKLSTDSNVMSAYPALSHAAQLVSSPQVRNVATLGGNLCLDARCNYYNQSESWRRAIGYCMKKDSEVCRVAPGGDRCWAVTSADTVPVLIALRAEVTIAGRDQTRRVPLDQMYQDDGLSPTTLRFGDIVTSVHVPSSDEWKCVYKKFRIRQSFDFPLIGVAVAVKRDVSGIVLDCRVVMTAVASYPERALEAESIVRGRSLDDDTIHEAGYSVFKAARPMDNTAGTIFHRKRMARVLFERSLREIAEQPILRG